MYSAWVNIYMSEQKLFLTPPHPSLLAVVNSLRLHMKTVPRFHQGCRLRVKPDHSSPKNNIIATYIFVGGGGIPTLN
jgi:hypothetical protein